MLKVIPLIRIECVRWCSDIADSIIPVSGEHFALYAVDIYEQWSLSQARYLNETQGAVEA